MTKRKKKSGKPRIVVTREVADKAGRSVSGHAGCLLFVSSGAAADRGKSVQLVKGSIVIGRDKDCGLVLEDDSASREHVRLTVTDEGLLVEDLGSKNGTTYLGKKIDRATLQIGVRLGIGDCRIDLLPLPGTSSIPISDIDSYGELVGGTLPMRYLYAKLQKLEGSDVPVLIEGETGTGKEMVARALHQHGLRADRSFVVVDCGNVPVSLMESEIFGHRKGAFTGAHSDREGAIATAEGGTLFLDEIDELPLELQPKFLRVLETGQTKRLGEEGFSQVDFRIIAATKKNLVDLVDRGLFREDLYYRIAVVRVFLPPLRERPEDIPRLARHLARKISDGRIEHLDPETEELLVNNEWRGNVRELRNAVERMLALGSAEIFFDSESRTPPSPSDPGPYHDAKDAAIREFTVEYLRDLMARCDGNLSRAARDAGLSRNHLRDLLKKNGLY